MMKVNKIPNRLLQRLGKDLSRRFEVSELIKKFEQFNRTTRLSIESLERKFPSHPFYRQPIKLLVVQAMATAGALAMFPPANEVPPIALPLVFAFTFCVAYILTALRIV
jgi:hypothetical protein